MNADEIDAEQLLRRALLSTPEREGLYAASAAFKASVDALINMLPACVDGLAAAAVDADAARLAAIAAIERAPLLGPLDIPAAFDRQFWPGPAADQGEG